MTTIPTRVEAELFEAARATGARMSRSATQQLAHWARLGRELEASSRVSTKDIERVLAGQVSYDALSDPDQPVVRAAWEESIEHLRGTLNYADTFRTSGESWSEADDDGTVHEHA